MVFDARTGVEKRRLDFSPLALGDGKRLLLRGKETNIKNPDDEFSTAPTSSSVLVWDGKMPEKGAPFNGVTTQGGFTLGGANNGRLSPDGSRLAAIGPYRAKIFDARTGAWITSIAEISERVPLDFSRDGRVLAILREGGAQILNATNGDSLSAPIFPKVKGLSARDSAADLSDDGKRLFFAMPTSTTTRGIYVLDLDAASTNAFASVGEKRFEFANGGRAITLSPTGDTLVAVGENLSFMRTQNGAVIRSPQGGDRAASVAWSPDGMHLITGGTSHSYVELWNAKTFSLETILATHEWPVNVVAWSPDGKIAASGGSGFTGESRPATKGLAMLFNTLEEGHRRYLTAMTGRVTAIAFSPDGKWVATGCDDGTFDIWSVTDVIASTTVNSVKPTAHIEEGAGFEGVGSILDIKWTPAGLYTARSGGKYGSIAVGGGAGQVLNVVSWQNGVAKTLRTFSLASKESVLATGFAISNDTKRFALCESTGANAKAQIFVRDSQTGATLKSLEVPIASHSMIFSPDGKTLYFQLENVQGKASLQKWEVG